MHHTSRPGTLISVLSAAALLLGVAGCVERESEDAPGESAHELVVWPSSIGVHEVTFPGPASTGLTGDLLSGVIYSKGGLYFDRPAVILMHGCTGMWMGTPGLPNARQNNIQKWGMKLAAHGFYVLAVDSFTRRGNDQNHCGEAPGGVADSYTDRARDVNAARGYLASLSGIDGSRIGLIGWSHGAQAAMVETAATSKDADIVKLWPPPAFPATVLFYPGCGLNLGFRTSSSLSTSFWRPRRKVRLNVGTEDSFAGDCETRTGIAVDTYLAGPGTYNEVVFRPFENAAHTFDSAGSTWPSSECDDVHPPGSLADQCAADTADIESLAFLLEELQD